MANTTPADTFMHNIALSKEIDVTASAYVSQKRTSKKDLL